LFASVLKGSLNKQTTFNSLSNLFFLLNGLLSVLLILLYYIYSNRGFDVSDEGFYLAKINGNILNGAEGIPFEKITNLFFKHLNFSQILSFRIANLALLVGSTVCFCYAISKLIFISKRIPVVISFYSLSVVSVLFFLNYYPNNISYNTLNTSFILLLFSAFVLFIKSTSKFRYIWFVVSSFFLAIIFFIKIPTFFILIFCLAWVFGITEKKRLIFLFILSVGLFVFILSKLTGIQIWEYLYGLLSSGSGGSHSLSFLLTLFFSYINNYFINIFIAVSVLLNLHFFYRMREFFPGSQKIIFLSFYYLFIFYVIYFFYYFFGSKGYGNEIIFLLFVLGFMSYFQTYYNPTFGKNNFYDFLALSLKSFKYNLKDNILLLLILLTPILAAIGTNNFFNYAILPYLILIAVPVLAVSHNSEKVIFNRYLLIFLFIILAYKGFYSGYIKKPYSLSFSESKLISDCELPAFAKLNGIKVGPELSRQIEFADSIFKANGYQKGDTMVTFNFTDGIAYILEAKILFSPIVNEADYDYYFSKIKEEVERQDKLYIIDNSVGKISDTTSLTKLGMSSSELHKLGDNSSLSLYLYKKQKRN
jgi:hypothetical protein